MKSMNVKIKFDDGTTAEFSVEEIVVDTWTPPTIEADGSSLKITAGHS